MCDKKFNRKEEKNKTWILISNISCVLVDPKIQKKLKGTLCHFNAVAELERATENTRFCVICMWWNNKTRVMSANFLINMKNNSFSRQFLSTFRFKSSTQKWSRFEYLNVTTVERDSDLFFLQFVFSCLCFSSIH